MGLLPELLARLDGKAPAKSQLVIDGKTVDVILRKNPRAKRIILRLAKSNDAIVLTVPRGTTHRAAMEFAASQGVWITQQMAKQPQTVSFETGAIIPLRNRPHKIIQSSTRRTPVWTGTGEDGEPVIYVSGNREHLARRVGDWLKKQARADLSQAAYNYADKMGVSISRISIRDTASRWGSCSSGRALSFSWRLILAPEFVLDYVAAHEVAHLVHMDHSKNFWALVRSHCSACDDARKWLKNNGRSLHRYGH